MVSVGMELFQQCKLQISPSKNNLSHDSRPSNSAKVFVTKDLTAYFKILDNGVNHVKDYKAKAGWDPCCGLGSPNGANLLAAL